MSFRDVMIKAAVEFGFGSPELEGRLVDEQLRALDRAGYNVTVDPFGPRGMPYGQARDQAKRAQEATSTLALIANLDPHTSDLLEAQNYARATLKD